MLEQSDQNTGDDMLKKILILFLVTITLTSVVSAADFSDFKAPVNFDDIGDGVFVLYDSSSNADEILSIVKYNEHDWNDYITNDTDNQYIVNGENNTYNYTDGIVNEVGSFELIEVDGDKFIIDFAKVDASNDFNQTFSNLINFNELNNVTPVES